MTNLEKLKAEIYAMSAEQFEKIFGDAISTCKESYGQKCPCPEDMEHPRCFDCSVKWLNEEINVDSEPDDYWYFVGKTDEKWEKYIDAASLFDQLMVWTGKLESNLSTGDVNIYAPARNYGKTYALGIEQGKLIALRGVKMMLVGFPSADVEVVRHEKWVNPQIHGGQHTNDGITRYICSFCGRSNRIKEPYCNCGAKMDGGENAG